MLNISLGIDLKQRAIYKLFMTPPLVTSLTSLLQLHIAGGHLHIHRSNFHENLLTG